MASYSFWIILGSLLETNCKSRRLGLERDSTGEWEEENCVFGESLALFSSFQLGADLLSSAEMCPLLPLKKL